MWILANLEVDKKANEADWREAIQNGIVESLHIKWHYKKCIKQSKNKIQLFTGV